MGSSQKNNKFTNNSKNEIKEIVEIKNEISQAQNKNLISIIQQTVKNEIKELSSLTEDHKKLAEEVAKGFANDDRKTASKYSMTVNELKDLKANPIFQQEVLKNMYSNTLSSKEKRLQLSSNLALSLFEKLTNNNNKKMDDLSARDMLKAFTELNSFIAKETSTEKESQKLDITVVMKQIGIDQRIKEENGVQFIESEFPVFNSETGKLEMANSNNISLK